MITTNAKIKNFAVVLQEVKTFDAAFLQRAARGMERGLRLAATLSQTDYLTGPRPDKLDVKTGRLRNSIAVSVEVVDGGVIGKEGSNVEYAARHEFGFTGVEQVKSFPRVILELAKSKGFIGPGFKAVDSRTVLTKDGQFAGYKESSRSRAAARKGNITFTTMVKAHERKVNYKGKPFVRPAIERMLPVITGEILKETLKTK